MGTVDILKPNTIYMYGNRHILWTGKEYFGDYLDKQYIGTYYIMKNISDAVQISLEDAVKQDLIDYQRFIRMNKEDATNTFKIIVKEKGVSAALTFLCNGKLDFSEKELSELITN